MAKYETYTVKPGDCLSVIAQKLLGDGNRWREIQKLNGLKSDVIYSGQVLKIREIPDEKPKIEESSEIKKAFRDCLSAIENLPEFKRLESLL